MKAVVYDRYGPPDVLRVEQVRMPTPGPKQVLVEVVATSVNLSDWECLRGTSSTRGSGACAGRRVGPSARTSRGACTRSARASRFRVGDEVYGDNLGLMGGFAEYAVAPESVLAHKPRRVGLRRGLDASQAAAIALQGNRRRGGRPAHAHQRVRRRQRVVRDPARQACGGARDRCRQRGQARVHAVAGRRRGGRPPPHDFTQLGPFDHILDLVAYRSVFTYRRALARGGRYRCVGGRCRPSCGSSRSAPCLAGSPGAASGCWWSSRAPRTSSPSPSGASPGMSRSTSTAGSAWTASAGAGIRR